MVRDEEYGPNDVIIDPSYQPPDIEDYEHLDQHVDRILNGSIKATIATNTTKRLAFK